MRKSIRIINILVHAGFLFLVTQGSGSDFSGARDASLGGASVALKDFWSLVNNQAGLAGYPVISAGAAFENKFLLKETGVARFGLVFPIRKNTLGVSLCHMGYSVFREMKIGLAFARTFGEKVNAGLQLDYLATSMANGYKNSGGVTFEAGIQVQLSKQLILAAHCFNPFAINYNSIAGESAASRYKLGVRYGFSRQLFFSLEMMKDTDFKPAVKMGLEYELTKTAFARIGYSTLPAATGSSRFSITSLMTCGFGLVYSSVVVDVAASFNASLGWSPSISICYGFGTVN